MVAGLEGIHCTNQDTQTGPKGGWIRFSPLYFMYYSSISQCGVFRRWYKFRQEDKADGDEQTDNELTYQRRTIPPLTFNGAPSSSPPPEGTWSWGKAGGKGEHEMSAKELEKEREAQAELEQEFHAMVSSGLCTT